MSHGGEIFGLGGDAASEPSFETAIRGYDKKQVERYVARAVESGNLSINSNSSVRVNTPFGGFKQSGYGRELGPHATDAYTEVKTIYINTEGTA